MAREQVRARRGTCHQLPNWFMRVPGFSIYRDGPANMHHVYVIIYLHKKYGLLNRASNTYIQLLPSVFYLRVGVEFHRSVAS